MSVQINTREVEGIIVMDLRGRVTLGEATGKVRETIRVIVTGGHRKVLLNLSELDYLDSAGLGEIIGAYTTMRNAGGEMKLLGVTGRALDLLQVTKLATLFELFSEEAEGLKSFSQTAS